VKECGWRGVVGIGTCRSIRGKGISASFDAPLELPAAGDGASVRAAALGAPHVGGSIQAGRAFHQNRDVQL
jgi:hypothetical protein